MELNDFDDFSGDLWVFDDPKSIITNPNRAITMQPNEETPTRVFNSGLQATNAANQDGSPASSDVDVVKRSGRHRSSALQMEEIQKYFDFPITRAAKELNVGLTVLKKRCRELNIARWPHRKIKSLKSLIHNVKVHPFNLI